MGRKQVLENGVGHRVEDPPVVGPFLRLLSLDDPGNRIGLLVSGARIDHRLHGAATLEDGAWPLEDQRHRDASQIDIAEMPFVDPKNLHTLTGCCGWAEPSNWQGHQ